uniref:Uncharacterized protein n=1 Tax=Arundo donax TaxID=35708 RepID=A0A0A9AK24_ARUDO
MQHSPLSTIMSCIVCSPLHC